MCVRRSTGRNKCAHELPLLIGAIDRQLPAQIAPFPVAPYASPMRNPTRLTCTCCGVVLTRGDCCDDCLAEQYSLDVPTCDAPGCTREIGMRERLCPVHVALANGEAPRLYAWQLDEIYRHLGDPEASACERHSVAIPGIGHVAIRRRRCEIDGVGSWYEWLAVAA